MRHAYWTCCVISIWLLAQLVAVNVRGDDCACVANSAAENAQDSYIAPAETASKLDFLASLNAERAKYNLQPVIGSQVLEWAADRNNAWQQIRGMGHHSTGGFGQCVAWHLHMSATNALQLWLSSPPHRSLILAADLSMIGYHEVGPYATVATWQGGIAAPQKQAEAKSAAPAGKLGSAKQAGPTGSSAAGSGAMGAKPSPHRPAGKQSSPVGAQGSDATASPQTPTQQVPGGRLGAVNCPCPGCGCAPTATVRRGSHPVRWLLRHLRVNVRVGITL